MLKLRHAGTASHSLRNLADFRNLHSAATVIVCGCGASLNDLYAPERFITIGVNDVGRKFDPTYLVVLNPRSQFKDERFRYVEHSRAQALFTQLDLGIKHPNIVRFKLGKRGGTDFGDPNVLPYTRNSPYVAVCLAVYMGAKRIGLIGVDFTDHHFFAQTGRHTLTNELTQIDQEYARLAEACARQGVEVVNLSRQSRLTAFPKIPIDRFCRLSTQQLGWLGQSRINRPAQARSNLMNIAIQNHTSGIIGDFFNALAKTAAQIGHHVTRVSSSAVLQRDVISVIWNGRNHRPLGPTLFCEHGWLPRWAYQISHTGINADSHIAPFRWDGETLTDQQLDVVNRHLSALREGEQAAREDMQTDRQAVEDLPEAFFLVPLQMEHDTNIVRHVPPGLQRMQALVDVVSASNPPLSVVYKQHPADQRRVNHHLHLKLRRKKDLLRPHNEGNIHQILKSGRCKGIITLNSNVAHDGFLWEVPAVVLGNNIWPRHGWSPFYAGLPSDWQAFETFFADPRVSRCREAYISFLISHQWTLTDARDPDSVDRLFHTVQTTVSNTRILLPQQRSPAKTKTTVINVVARNRGWLFEDLKRHFCAFTQPNVTILASEHAQRQADAWIYLRTYEAVQTPDPARTIVQIHDLFDDGLYRPEGRRRIVERCAALTLTHPRQKQILSENGIRVQDKEVLCRPLGALKIFRLRESLPPRFTLGWVGRPVQYKGIDVKRAAWLVEVLKQLGPAAHAFHVCLLGERLDDIQRQIQACGVETRYFLRSDNPIQTYPAHYQNLDCLVITSLLAAGPNSLYEALSCGIPVVSTPIGWAPELIRNGENGFLVNTVSEMMAAIEHIHQARDHWFQRREAIRSSLQGYTLESWIEENVAQALQLVHGEKKVNQGAPPELGVRA